MSGEMETRGDAVNFHKNITTGDFCSYLPSVMSAENGVFLR